MPATVTILVFRTSLSSKTELEKIAPLLNATPGIESWSVDMEDWEKVLRIETESLSENEIEELLKKAGIECEALED